MCQHNKTGCLKAHIQKEYKANILEVQCYLWGESMILAFYFYQSATSVQITFHTYTVCGYSKDWDYAVQVNYVNSCWILAL